MLTALFLAAFSLSGCASILRWWDFVIIDSDSNPPSAASSEDSPSSPEISPQVQLSGGPNAGPSNAIPDQNEQNLSVSSQSPVPEQTIPVESVSASPQSPLPGTPLAEPPQTRRIAAPASPQVQTAAPASQDPGSQVSQNAPVGQARDQLSVAPQAPIVAQVSPAPPSVQVSAPQAPIAAQVSPALPPGSVVPQVPIVPQASPPVRSPSQPQASRYTVRWGDSLWKIAANPGVYNNPYQWRRLYNANKRNLINPNNPHLILPGMVLVIPRP
jgi:nucleoid-associated protein YgaU